MNIFTKSMARHIRISTYSFEKLDEYSDAVCSTFLVVSALWAGKLELSKSYHVFA